MFLFLAAFSENKTINSKTWVLRRESNVFRSRLPQNSSESAFGYPKPEREAIFWIPRSLFAVFLAPPIPTFTLFTVFPKGRVAFCTLFTAFGTLSPHLFWIFDGRWRVPMEFVGHDCPKTRARALLSIQNTSEKAIFEVPDRYLQCFVHTWSPLVAFLTAGDGFPWNL